MFPGRPQDRGSQSAVRLAGPSGRPIGRSGDRFSEQFPILAKTAETTKFFPLVFLPAEEIFPALLTLDQLLNLVQAEAITRAPLSRPPIHARAWQALI